MDDQNVILVDSHDNQVGLEDKLIAHKASGKLHRAVSVLVFRVSGGFVETLVQKRSGTKLLWPGFWTNTICTHPMKNETFQEAGVRRLQEEMGIRISQDILTFGFRFEYQAQFSPEFAEHELDTVLFAVWDGNVKPNPKEADDAKWIRWKDLVKDIRLHSGAYTPWFRQIVVDDSTERYIKTL